MRIIVAAGALLLLSGCASIPPAVGVAAWAIGGATQALSGKSLPDHALSFVAQKDCGMWRLIKGQPVCQDYPTEDGYALVAYSEAAARPVLEADIAAPARAPVAEAPREPARDRSPQAAVRPRSRTMLAAALSDIAPGAGFARSGQARGAVVSDLEWGAPTGSASGKDSGPDDRPAVTPDAEAEVALRSGHPPVLSEAEGASRYLVVASFLVPAHAEALMVRLRALAPTMAKATVDGRHFRRVVVGPFRDEELAAARQRIEAAGIHGAWLLPDTAGPRQRPVVRL